jgi:tRNA (adenine57-N1/adenine58-N1)-methyltransferase
VAESLRLGETVLLIDEKEKRFLVKLSEGGRFEYHRGILTHAEITSAPEGSVLTSTGGGRLTVIRPRLADFILKMPRGAQVVYPKDIGPILVWADIGPAMTVLEAGTGSGALTIALARAVGPSGRVVTVERREDHSTTAVKSITRWFGEIPPWLEMRSGEVEDVIAEVAPDRLVLDLPEPWHAARIATESMPPGSILCAYIPTVPQVQNLVETLRETDRWTEIEVSEHLYRTWNVLGRSVRPDHQMIGHTGFLVIARKVTGSLPPDPTAPEHSELPNARHPSRHEHLSRAVVPRFGRSAFGVLRWALQSAPCAGARAWSSCVVAVLVPYVLPSTFDLRRFALRAQ